ncbi:ESPR-type extended signal peptide-containing protein [Dyella sp.]|uniref:ESPR-type extended signal peptide-containing protein n=1 Tax=Dyella sp. TaxID=1869338 RepID=UPI0039C865DD
MNKTYRLVWSRSTGASVAFSELAAHADAHARHHWPPVQLPVSRRCHPAIVDHHQLLMTAEGRVRVVGEGASL